MKVFSILALSLIACTLLAVGFFSCARPVYYGNAGYDDGYVQPFYQPNLTVVYVGGRRGYYDSYHVFQPMVIINGAEGYRNSSGYFVSSHDSVKQSYYSKKPFYTGRSTSTYSPTTRPSSPPILRERTTRPDYGSSNSSQRVIASPKQYPPLTPSRPNYGSGGSSSRVSSPSYSKPSYSSGSSSRSSSPSSSSSRSSSSRR